MTISVSKISEVNNYHASDVSNDGQLQIGDKTYSVRMINNKIDVNRQDIASNHPLNDLYRMVNAIYDFFSRMLDDNESAFTTRANAMESSLNNNLMYERSNFESSKQDIKETIDFTVSLLVDHTQENLLSMNINTISDSENVREFIRNNLDNPYFSSDRLRSFTYNSGETDIFTANFNGTKIQFSDRHGSNGELRGDSLKSKLEGNYANLRDLLTQDFMTDKDTTLVYAVNAIKMTIRNADYALPIAYKGQLLDQFKDQPFGNATLKDFY